MHEMQRSNKHADRLVPMVAFQFGGVAFAAFWPASISCRIHTTWYTLAHDLPAATRAEMSVAKGPVPYTAELCAQQGQESMGGKA